MLCGDDERKEDNKTEEEKKKIGEGAGEGTTDSSEE